MARPVKNPKTVEKVCEQCKKIFNVNFQKRNIQRFCGKVCSNANPETRNKIEIGQKDSYDKKWGGEHPMKRESVRNNLKKSLMLKYGVEHALQSSEFLEKSNDTKLKRYNDVNFNNRPKSKETCIEKYGVDNFRKTKYYDTKFKKTCLEKYGVIHSSKSVEYKLCHKILMFEKFLKNERFKNFKPKFSIEDYRGVTTVFNQKYSFECIRCNGIESHFINNGIGPRCTSCDKKYSVFQSEIQDFIRSLYTNQIIINDRSMLKPMELDIYIPSLKLAIECDSLCFHSEIFGNKNKTYHLNKTKNCSLKGIRLIHVWDSEWFQKKDIVKSIFSNILGKCQNRFFARNCKIKEVKYEDCSKFLIENHIQGSDHSSIRYGLFNDDKLLSIMTFCKSRFNKMVEWELSRFCNKLNYNITGGASRLFNHFLKNNIPRSVISYSDRRFFTGDVYPKLGFVFSDYTIPSYHYIVDSYSTTQNRISWQKHKLKNKLMGFDPELTEWENVKNHGIDRIWDCGHGKWIYSNPNIINPTLS